MSKQIYIVDGVYEDELQITGDFVMAGSVAEAERLVREVREVAADEWHCEGAYTLKKQVTLLQIAATQTPKEIREDLEETLKSLGGARCGFCRKPFPEDDLEDGLCEGCYIQKKL